MIIALCLDMHHGLIPAGKSAKQAAAERALAEAIALAIASAASDERAFREVRAFCRRLESALLASDAGPLGWSLLETVDARLREAFGAHDLLDGRYA